MQFLGNSPYYMSTSSATSQSNKLAELLKASFKKDCLHRHCFHVWV